MLLRPHFSRGVLRQLAARFDVATAPDELVAATRQAIVDAMFGERDINRNFDTKVGFVDQWTTPVVGAIPRWK